ncbi:HNH endonuclease [Blastococcus sp. KM273128]|uniref:HNH endonuclease n=1 Tax=Blastococcus sp. KM273128 TaxID=2570314 RepID=UPI001F471C0B|nr:HNH endonuclease signature motif containing protein [Blastococcus sp. KM273128]
MGRGALLAEDIVGEIVTFLTGGAGKSLLTVALLFALAWRLAHHRSRPQDPGHRDPVRRFSRVQKAEILRRAGHRCEHPQAISGRCSATTQLEADHVHPHSRGGWTMVENGQALCRRHNKQKRARVPSNADLRLLARRRIGYFPQGVPTVVTRFAPRGVDLTPVVAAAASFVSSSGRKPGLAASSQPPPVTVPPPVGAGVANVHLFEAPRTVEVLVDGTWWPGLQRAWRRDENGWMAEVAWFEGYGGAGGSRVATLPAALIRLPTAQSPSDATRAR